MTSQPIKAADREVKQKPDKEVWYVSITDFPHGLASTARARSMCRALDVAGYETCLLIPYALGHGKNQRIEGVDGGVRFEYISRSTTRPATALGVALAKFSGALILFRRMAQAKERLAGVVLNAGSIFDCWGVLMARRLWAIPAVLDLTDEWHDPALPIRSLGAARYLFQLLTKATEGIVFRSVSNIIVVSRHFERRLNSHADKMIRCPVAFDPKPFETAEPIRLAGADEFVILYAGSVSLTEGIDVLIEAVRRVHRNGRKHLRLFVVGNPAYRETIDQYKTAAGELLVDGSVSFLPAVDHQRYASLLKGADLLVIPRPTTLASQAGFPYKLVEYIASGVPVLVTRFGDVEEYFKGDVHCLMCDPGDPESLAARIEFAIEHRSQLRALAIQGERRAKELFALDAVAGQLRELINHGPDGRKWQPASFC